MNTFRPLSVSVNPLLHRRKKVVFLSSGGVKFNLCEVENISESLKFSLDLLVLGALERPNMEMVPESRKREDAH